MQTGLHCRTNVKNFTSLHAFSNWMRWLSAVEAETRSFFFSFAAIVVGMRMYGKRHQAKYDISSEQKYRSFKKVQIEE
jgi:hypothetical protein